MDVDARFNYHRHLSAVVAEDVREVRAKDTSYGASWKKRGGTGAFMMLARKWDRLEEMLSFKDGTQYNIFAAIAAAEGHQGADGTVLAEIRDLRRYLLLVECQMIEEGAVVPPVLAADLYADLSKVEGVTRRDAKSAVLAASYERMPAAVPVEDSNRHAPRSLINQFITKEQHGKLNELTSKEYVAIAPETYALPDFVSVDKWHTMHWTVKDLYIPLSEKVYAIDRNRVDEGLFSFRGRWMLIINHTTHKELHPHERELYIVADDKIGYVMKADLQSTWGKP